MDIFPVPLKCVDFGTDGRQIVARLPQHRKTLPISKIGLNNLANLLAREQKRGIGGAFLGSVPPIDGQRILRQLVQESQREVFVIIEGDTIVGFTSTAFTHLDPDRLYSQLSKWHPDLRLETLCVGAEETILALLQKPFTLPQLRLTIEHGVRIRTTNCARQGNLEAWGFVRRQDIRGDAFVQSKWASEGGHPYYRTSEGQLLAGIKRDIQKNLVIASEAVERVPRLTYLSIDDNRYSHSILESRLHEHGIPYQIGACIFEAYRQQASNFGQNDLALWLGMLDVQHQKQNAAHALKIAFAAGMLLTGQL